MTISDIWLDSALLALTMTAYLDVGVFVDFFCAAGLNICALSESTSL